MQGSAEANFMMVLSFVLPVFFIIAAKWLIPLLEKKFADKAKTVYIIVAFVIVIVMWYLIDTRYGFHMGLW
jgi:Kef-type K+ transport system membrane component KefB